MHRACVLLCLAKYDYVLESDARMANRELKTLGLVGAKTIVDPEGSLRATVAVDFVCREEFDYTRQEVATVSTWARSAGCRTGPPTVVWFTTRRAR